MSDRAAAANIRREFQQRHMASAGPSSPAAPAEDVSASPSDSEVHSSPEELEEQSFSFSDSDSD